MPIIWSMQITVVERHGVELSTQQIRELVQTLSTLEQPIAKTVADSTQQPLLQVYTHAWPRPKHRSSPVET